MPFAPQREQVLLHQLEEAVAEKIEWRGLAHKLKEDIAWWAEECERLKQLAQTGPATGSSSKKSTGSNSETFKKLKALLSKGLHPDNAKDPTEKKIRTKLFQELWPQINDLENRA
jgi:hypothetical protein